ncbi:MAG: permease [Opitutaceae bacterium]|nr:permease [Opitutaceae bacterium]
MSQSKEWKILAGMAGVFAVFYLAPLGHPRVEGAVTEALALTQWYAREHVILCLLPAFWIAGAIGTFVSQQSVMRYFGPDAPKATSYGVASVSGTILAVCSCTVLPLFSGIYRMGAGLGPAVAFLYSGPAINALAIILTAKVLGLQLGVARAVGAVVFSVVIGVIMHLLFRREERAKAAKIAELPESAPPRPLWQTSVFFGLMVGVLVFANWGHSDRPDDFFARVHVAKWWITSGLAVLLGLVLWRWLKLAPMRLAAIAAGAALTAALAPGHPTLAVLVSVAGLAWATAGQPGEAGEWFSQSWDNAKQIFPLLIGGVLVAGLLLGRPGHEGLVPNEWIARSVGGNSLAANAFSAVAGALMYFATLTEVPILQGLIGSGMGTGPALALLLAGPALSLPSMIVINSVIGPKKTAAYVGLVVVLSTLVGWGYGEIAG